MSSKCLSEAVPPTYSKALGKARLGKRCFKFDLVDVLISFYSATTTQKAVFVKLLCFVWSHCTV